MSLILVTGWRTPSTGANAGSGNAWSNPSNITADDGSLASVTTTVGQGSQFLVGGTYSANIPTNAEILGIEVQVKGGVGSGQNQRIRLTKDGSTDAGDFKTATQSTSNTDVVTYGSGTDLWGTTWTPAQVNATTFGAMFDTFRVVSGGSGASIDIMSIRIYFKEDRSGNFLAFM